MWVVGETPEPLGMAQRDSGSAGQRLRRQQRLRRKQRNGRSDRCGQRVRNGREQRSGSAGSTVTGTGGGPTVTPPKQALTTPDKCTSNVPGPRKLWRLSGPEFTASIRVDLQRHRERGADRDGVQRPDQPRVRDRRQRAAGAGAERLAASGQRRGDRGLGGVGEQAADVRQLLDAGYDLRHEVRPGLRPARRSARRWPRRTRASPPT